MALEGTDLGIVVTYAVGIGLLSLAPPIAVQSLLGFVAFGGLLQPIIVLSLVLAVVLLFVAGLKAAQTLAVEHISRRIFLRVGASVAARMVQPAREKNLVKLTSRFFDVVTLEKAAATLLFDGVTVVLQIFAGMALLAVYHPVLLAFDIVVAGLVALLVLLPGRTAIRTALEESTAKYEVADWLEDLALNPGLYANRQGAAFAQPRTDGVLASWLSARRRHFSRVFVQIGGFLLMQALALCALLVVGGWLVVERELAVGQLVAAELVMASTVAAIARLGKLLQTSYDLLAAVQKIGYATDGVVRDDGKGRLEPSTEGLAVDVHNPIGALRLAPGSKTRLVGPEGAGKTTLLLALAHLNDERFAVTLDGVDARSLDGCDTRALVHLLGDTGLIEGTIEDNLRVADPSASVQKLYEALDCVGLTETVRVLPGGIHTELLPGGTPLSGGQTKRLLAARALLLRPRLLLIDRFLDDLPDEPLELLLHYLLRPEAPWTVLCVSDDPRVLPHLSEHLETLPRADQARVEVAA
jgi:putative ABC transport system ATP-binding protein